MKKVDRDATSVQEYLAARAHGKDAAGKLALVIQGGGMRGVYSMGALSAMEESGLRNAFDIAVGSSAGAINLSYFLAGQAHDAVKAYVDLLSNRSFVNPLRLWKIVDIDYLVDGVLKRLCPLDVAALRLSPTLLEVVLTDAKTAEPVVVTNRSEYDLYEVIRATAALPGLYNRKVKIGRNSFVDGGVADSLPVDRALITGATSILAVTTRELKHRHKEEHPVQRWLIRSMSVGQSAAIKETMGREDTSFNKAMDLLEGRTQRQGLRTWYVYPRNGARLVDRVTTDKNVLKDCAEMGREDMLRLLESSCEYDCAE